MAKTLAFLQSKDIIVHSMKTEKWVIEEHLLLCLREVQSLSSVRQTGTGNSSNDLSSPRASLGKLSKGSSKSTTARNNLQDRRSAVLNSLSQHIKYYMVDESSIAADSEWLFEWNSHSRGQRPHEVVHRNLCSQETPRDVLS
jgi:hypothetical protein